MSQVQKAGSSSAQVQIAGDFVIVQGISEERARNISKEIAEKAVADYTFEAAELARERISRFDDLLIKRLEKLEKLGVFGDPSFQILARKAQIGAASSGDDLDYDLLVRLIEDRIQRGEQRMLRAGIDRAVEVIDLVDQSALTGLTVVRALQQFRPESGSANQGLQALDALFGQFDLGLLPSGGDWIDHLDVLDALRSNSIGRIKPFSEFFPQSVVPGYVCSGNFVASPEHDQVIGRMHEIAPIPIVPHEFKPGYVRLPYPSPESFEKVLQKNLSALGQDRIEELLVIAKRDFGLNGTADPDCVAALMDAVENLDNLAIIKRWWDALPNSFQVTPVGRVLSTANAKRCDKAGMLPPLD